MRKSSFLRASGIGRGVRLLTPGSVRVVALVLGTFLILGLVRIAFPGLLPAVFGPIWKVGSAGVSGVGVVQTFFSDKEHLARERDELQSQNEGLMSENNQLQARLEDYTKLLGARTASGPGVLAGVLARPPVSPYDVLVIDRGTESGIESGSLVFGNGGVPLGTIAATTANSSRVLLFSAPGREVSAWVGSGRLPVTLLGQGSGAFTALVPRDAGVVVGHEVYVSGPGALPIGTVTAVEADPSATKSRVRIHPLSNPFSIPWVTVSNVASL